MTYSNGDLTATGTNSASAAGTGNVRTTNGKSSGKVYWEITVVDGSNGADGIPDEGGVGILESAAPNDSYIGVTDSGLSWGYGTAYYDSYWYTWSGATVNGAPPSGSAVKKGIVYMFALDMDLGEFWAGQDGTWYGAGDPGNGLNPVATGLSGTVYAGATFYAPAASPTGTGNGYVYPTAANSLTANFGASSFAYPVPIGFQAGFY